MSLRLSVDEHPRLHLEAFVTRFGKKLAELELPSALPALLRPDAETPVERSEELRKAVRDLLRFGGYRPTGRGKPSAEYLVRAADDGSLSSINPAVDACNAVSLASGLPISVVDLDRVHLPLRVKVAADGASYVFNPTGQTIDLGGLLCLFDGQGPCANAVKDAQRTKTDGGTTRTLSLLWAPQGFEEVARRTAAWYRELLAGCGAETEPGVAAAGGLEWQREPAQGPKARAGPIE